MPDFNAKTMTCPACGAPLDYDGSSVVVRCIFCHNVVVIDALKSKVTDKIDQQKLSRVPDDIIQLIRAGNRLEAIKRYRELFDVSLERAKYAIEQIELGNLLEPEAGFPARQVESAVKTSAVTATAARGIGFGCGLILLIIFILIACGIFGNTDWLSLF